MNLFERAEKDPDGIAVDDLTRRRSWGELAERSSRVANFLRREAGIAPGEHVALLMGNRSEYIELLLGGILAGAWVTPISWHLAEEEVAYIVRDSRAKLVFSDDALAPLARAAGAPRLLAAGAELDAALDAAPCATPDFEGPAGGNMIYTSGTTGRPKGVKRRRPATVAAALAAQAGAGAAIGLDGSGPHLVTGPLYHAAPLMFAVYDQACGAPIVIMPRWDERQALALLAERAIAHTHLVPTMFVRLLRLPEAVRKAFRAPQLSLVLHGAAPVSVAVKRRMLEWWGPVLVEYWGGTEGGVNTLVDSATWLANPGTVGRALPAFEIFAVDGSGRRLPPGEVGNLYCRHRPGTNVFEYHAAPQKTAEAHLEPGVFTIGDVGQVDADGFVHLSDRQSHTIISGGVNVYPAEIEQMLALHPAVADCGVFGIPDEEWGESVKAAVELAPGYRACPELADEILAFARERLAGYKLPRSIDFHASLPRHPTGKLQIRQLKEPWWRGRERRI